MSEGDAPPAAAFTRGCRARASLPLVRSASQARDSSLGVLFLQYGEETRQVRLPGEISGADAVRALFVSAFPQQLTMTMLASPGAAVYIRDHARNVYHELSDVRNITSQSCLKVYHRDPAHAFNRHSAPPTKADGRTSREILYGNQSPAHALQTPGRGALHGLPGSMSPPIARSMPSSPSRIPYGSRGGGEGPGGGGAGTPGEAGSATLPRERVSSAGAPGRPVAPCSSSSAIMERRDVKPDEDMGGSKSMALLVRGEGGLYPDPYPGLQGSGSAQQADVVDSGVGLQQQRVSSKTYGDTLELQHSLYRQKSRRYGESQLPPLGLRSPPPSPHRMIDGHSAAAAHGRVTPERMSPVRRSLRRDGSGAAEVVGRTRSSVSSSSSSSAFVDFPAGPHDRPLQGHMTPSDPQTSERMKAMEQQIASLTGLVQHALAIGPAISERDGKTANLPVNSSLARSPDPRTDVSGASPQAPPPDAGLRTALSSAQRNVTDLRLQLQLLRQMQVQNQESVRAMLRMMAEELASMAAERLRAAEGRPRGPEEPGRQQRAAVGDERLKYLTTEERVLTQLGELEEYVERLKRDSSPLSSASPGPPSVTLKDVEEGAVTLRRVGEALAGLKGEFPGLQGRMRSVLRVEVEAVRFLKEEPHKMDSMLRRVKALTQELSELRRCVTETHPHGPEASVEGQERTDAVDPPPRPAAATPSPRPQPRSAACPPPATPAARPEATPPGAPASPVAAYRLRSSPAATVACQHSAPTAMTHHHHQASPPLTPTHGPDTPTVAKVSPCSREGSPALRKKAAPRGADGNAPSPSPSPPASVAETAAGAEAAEREGGEARQGDPHPSSSSDFEQILQEAQARLMRAIPDLEVAETGKEEEEEEEDPCSPSPPEQPPQAPDRPVSDLTPTPPDELDAPPPSPAAPEGAPQCPVPAEAPPPPGTGAVFPSATAEKPGRPGVDGERRERETLDKTGKSPPPPPPRRFFYPASPGLTTGRSGEVIYTARKEHVATQEEDEAVVVPQPKPIRQPPEVKPKPQTNQVAAPASETAHQEDEEEEDQFMKELQVFQKCSVREVGGARCVVDLSESGSLAREIEAPPPVSPTHTQSASSPSSGRLSLSRSVQRPSGSPDKPAKGPALQDNQRQFRQPRLLAVPR